MKQSSFLAVLLLLAVFSSAQDAKTGRAPHDADMQRRSHAKYSLMDYTQQERKEHDALEYHRPADNSHPALQSAPKLRTYQFGKDKYGVPVKKKD